MNNYDCTKRERLMPDTGVKTLCTLCAHKEVCTYKQDYLDFIKAIENATTNASHRDFIGAISVGCKYYGNWTDTYRAKEAIL